MIKEAVDNFHALPRQVMESGREVPITADTDINTVILDEFKKFLPDGEYYNGRWFWPLTASSFTFNNTEMLTVPLVFTSNMLCFLRHSSFSR